MDAGAYPIEVALLKQNLADGPVEGAVGKVGLHILHRSHTLTGRSEPLWLGLGLS
jgi:hypothetical protein